MRNGMPRDRFFGYSCESVYPCYALNIGVIFVDTVPYAVRDLISDAL